MIVPEESSRVTVPPELLSERLPVEEMKTCAPAKAGCAGLKVEAFPPPKTMMAAPAGKIVPEGNLWRTVFVVAVLERVRI